MRAIRRCIGLGVAALLLAAPSGAGATVIGELDPSSTDPGLGGACVGTNENYVQAGVAPGDPSYVVPAGGGTLTSWSTKFGVPGSTISLEIWRPKPISADYDLVALDTRLIAPNQQGVSTYQTSIPVQAGDLLGMQQPAATTLHCGFQLHPSSVERFVFRDTGSPSVGTNMQFNESGAVFSILLNLTATVQQTADLSLSQTATPASVHAGDIVQLLFDASNAGPAPSPATFSDQLPAGLTALSAVAQDGSCTLGATVSCQLLALGGGTSALVVINAEAMTPGSYTNLATISGLSSNTDPDLTNNTASAAVQVLSSAGPPPPTKKCTVPNLKGMTLSAARTRLVRANCALGTVTRPRHHRHTLVVVSQKVAPGTVEPAGTQVAIRLGIKPKPKRR